jgi:uncharacterized protein YgiM (DUF1202 family)
MAKQSSNASQSSKRDTNSKTNSSTTKTNNPGIGNGQKKIEIRGTGPRNKKD